MIYKFKSKGAGDVIMLEATGERILRLLGREPAPQGIIEVKDMPRAIQALEQAVAAEEQSATQDDEREEDEADAAQDEGARKAPGRRVSLRQRVWPLIEMMRRCHAAGHDIVWGV